MYRNVTGEDDDRLGKIGETHYAWIHFRKKFWELNFDGV